MNASGIVFDFRYVDQALRMLEGRQAYNARALGTLPAVEHLRRHAERFGLGAVPGPAELVETLLEPFFENPQHTPDVRNALGEARRAAEESNEWLAALRRLIPAAYDFTGVHVYLTLGYDVGVVSDPYSVSVNLGHRYLRENPHHVRYFYMHELHHAAYLAHHNLPKLREVERSRELIRLVEGLTHLEGLGTYSPWALREKEGALNVHPDYVALVDESRMRNLEDRYWTLYDQLLTLPERITKDDVVRVLVQFGEPDKLFHLVGARLVKRLHERAGLRRVVELVVEGPHPFVELAGRLGGFG